VVVWIAKSAMMFYRFQIDIFNLPMYIAIINDIISSRFRTNYRIARTFPVNDHQILDNVPYVKYHHYQKFYTIRSV
jgi:hypothetical protein